VANLTRRIEEEVAMEVGAVLQEIEAQSRHHAPLRTGLWVTRSSAFVRGMLPSYIFLRGRSDPHYTDHLIRDNFDLDAAEGFAWDKTAYWRGVAVREAGYFERTYGAPWLDAIRPFQDYIKSVPGYDLSRMGRQVPETKDQYQFVVRQLARLWCERLALVKDTLPGAVDANRILILDVVRKGGLNEVSDHC